MSQIEFGDDIVVASLMARTRSVFLSLAVSLWRRFASTKSMFSETGPLKRKQLVGSQV